MIGHPFAGGAAVIEIEHRGDRIDAQAVDAVPIEPEQRVGDQEVDGLGAAVIVDQRSPVEMPALQRIGVLVQRGTVETAEPVGIVGEMAGHPVEPDADSLVMAGLDQSREILRAAKAACRRKKPGRLITPRAVERMFADGKELDMGEAHVMNVGRQLLGQFTIAQPFVMALAPPRSEMHLVDRYRPVQRIDVSRRRSRARQSSLVEHDRRRARTDFGGEGRADRTSAANARPAG